MPVTGGDQGADFPRSRTASRRWPRRPGPTLVALCAALGATVGAFPVGVAHAGTGPQPTSGSGSPLGQASTGVSADQAQVTALEQRIESDGAIVQRLVTSYDQTESEEATLDSELQATAAHLAADQRAEARARTVLRQLAIDNYVSGCGASASLADFELSSAMNLAAQQEYSRIAAARLSDAVNAVALDEQQSEAAEATLHSEQVQAQATLAELSKAGQAAQLALDQDQQLLGQAQSNLEALTAVVEQLSDDEEEEEELAQSFTPNPLSFSLNATAGSYVNPLRSINALYPERIDQGVDYSGYGPIYAIGDGVVLSTTNSGWPGGTFISYRLTDGPAGGLVVYAAEDIYPSVQVGASVTPDTVLGLMYEGPDGIETGWADPSGDGLTMARDAGQFSGANSTAFGANFSGLLQTVGAPPGVLQNDPPTGTLPPGWPVW